MKLNRRFCIAPMMDWTDRHDRYFLRNITKHSVLYTEMVTTGAVIHGDREKLLGFDPSEHPIAVQLGGSNPIELAEAAQICQSFGYDEINLNVGCPSDRVQQGKIGACLMLEPELVAKCVEKMRSAVSVPVTIKCRIGVDEQDHYDDLHRFIGINAEAGCSVFIIHARKAWLSGLSPKQNREIPPLNYSCVYQIKQDYPELEIILNGGINDLHLAKKHLIHVDGVMMGREAYHNPYILALVDNLFYNDTSEGLSRDSIVKSMFSYIREHLEQGGRLHQVTRHMLGLFHAQPNGRLWRRHLSEHAVKSGANLDVLMQALEMVYQPPAGIIEQRHQ